MRDATVAAAEASFFDFFFNVGLVWLRVFQMGAVGAVSVRVNTGGAFLRRACASRRVFLHAACCLIVPRSNRKNPNFAGRVCASGSELGSDQGLF